MLIKWKNSRQSGLTSETFLACIQSMQALPLLANHLVHHNKFSFVLSGKFLSDPLEARFGWYQQMNGSNFFMSLKQLLESEKKIRVLTKLQQHLLLSASALPDNEVVLLDTPPPFVSNTHWLSTFLLDIDLSELCHSDANVVFFVSGYIGRSIACQQHCASCKTLLVASDDAPNLQQCIPESSRNLFKMADRGGLSSPTEMCFAVTALAVQYYNAILSDQNILTKLLLEKNQCATFVQAVCIVTSAVNLSSILSHQCSVGHVNFQLILKRVFNCFAKIELKHLNVLKSDTFKVVTKCKIQKLNAKGPCN